MKDWNMEFLSFDACAVQSLGTLLEPRVWDGIGGYRGQLAVTGRVTVWGKVSTYGYWRLLDTAVNLVVITEYTTTDHFDTMDQVIINFISYKVERKSTCLLE